MAAPSVATVGTINAAATLDSTTFALTVKSNTVVTALTLTSSSQVAKLKDGSNVTVGLFASDNRDELKVDFVYKGSDFPRIPLMEVITISASSNTVIDGKWFYVGDLNKTFAAGDFAKYSMTLRRHYDVDGAASTDLAVPSQT